MATPLTVLPASPASARTNQPTVKPVPFKIILADPPARDDDYDKAYPNLGLLQLIAYVREQTPLADEDIIFLDQFHSLEDHIRIIEQVKPKLYGLSFAFLTQRIAYHTINELKRRFPDLLIIAGGPHPTSMPRDVMQRTQADIVCIGEGEMTLADIINVMAAKLADDASSDAALDDYMASDDCGAPIDCLAPDDRMAPDECVAPTGSVASNGSVAPVSNRWSVQPVSNRLSADTPVNSMQDWLPAEDGSPTPHRLETGAARECLTTRYDFSKIPGLLIRTPDGPLDTGKPRAYENLDELPFMSWDRIDFSKFVGQHYCKSNKQTCIVISRGCPYKCTFCSLPVWRAAKPYVRMRSPENIAREVDWLYKLGVREIKIVSDEINVTLPWAKAVCKAIGDLGHKDLYFQSNLRADKIDDELAYLFKRMNMWLVHLGVESANDRVLEGIEKKITVAEVERCLKFLKKHDVRVLLFMMAFQLWEENGELKWETPKEIRRSLRWVWKQFLLGRMNYMTWSIATPMPGAPLQEIVERHGLPASDLVLDNWNRNKDYLGIDLRPLGITEKTKMRLLRAGILSKAVFMMFGGNFDWKRHFYRIGILIRSFFGQWNVRAPQYMTAPASENTEPLVGPTKQAARANLVPVAQSTLPILNTPLRTKVEG